MPKIKFYDDHELEGLTDAQLDHLRLVSRVLSLDEFADASADELESLPDAELLALLDEPVPAEVPDAPVKIRKPRMRKTVRREKGLPLDESFAVIDGVLMRRIVFAIERFEGERLIDERRVESLEQCGERVTWDGRIYYSSVIAHRLITGEWVARAPRVKQDKRMRYRARVRTPEGLVHLGYFDTVADRDAAVFAYKVGVR